MANVLTTVIPKLLAQGLLALRENAVMPRLVNNDYSALAAQRGDVINVPIPSAVTAMAVTAAINVPANADQTPTVAQINLNNWWEAPFHMSDKDMKEAMSGFIPMQASEAIKALANKIDQQIMSLYKKVYGFSGTVGTTPFSASVAEATEARKVLNNQLCPMDNRRMMIDPNAEANALGLRAFQDMSFSGSAQGIQEGMINRKLGFDWFMDQNAPTHLNGAQDGAYTVNGVNALGSTSLVVQAGTGALKEGDTFTIAGDTQTYIVAADYVGGAGTVTIAPGLKVATGGAEVITFKGILSTTYEQNLAFHRDAFAFASRPLTDVGTGLGSIIQAAVDPVSGLTLRLEVSRQYKQTRFSYDILYGYACVRPELACRIWGATV